MAISLHDVEKLQALYPNHQIELREGNIVIMSPSDNTSGEIGVLLSILLGSWVYRHKLGHLYDSNTGIRMPNGDMLSPDISFVSRARFKRPSRTYLPVVPELIVEIKSSSDRISQLQEKITLFLSQGVQVGILIDPDKHIVTVYRSGEPNERNGSDEPALQKTTLKDGDILTIPELFPGWEIQIADLWPPAYE